jgi:hypothetical protein
MSRAIGLPLAAAVGVFLYGCAVEVQDAKFSRRATSPIALQSDSDQCWKIAQKSNITDSEATTDMAASWFFFGAIGAAVSASNTEEARKDPKNYHRRKVHEECMTQRGYKKLE